MRSAVGAGLGLAVLLFSLNAWTAAATSASNGPCAALTRPPTPPKTPAATPASTPAGTQRVTGSAASSGVGSETPVTVIVPPVTVARLDADGEPAAVETNNGQAPACTDLFLVASGSGSTQAGTLAQENQVMREVRPSTASASWRPGWHLVRPAG